MKINKKSLGILITILLLLLLILLLNSKSIGKTPILHSLSNSVVEPGDKITIYGEYFGGEISRGRVFINDKMVFGDFIESWDNDKIVLTLSDDFKSGMIKIVNMFGESKPYLITSKLDVPKKVNQSTLQDSPKIYSAEYTDLSELKVNIQGLNFGVYGANSFIEVTDNNGFINLINSDSIITWRDDIISFYLPYSISEINIKIIKNYGESNLIKLNKSYTAPLSFIVGEPINYKLEQLIELNNIITLGPGKISLYVPCVIPSLNQTNISFNSDSGLFNKESNIFNYTLDFKETGESRTISLFTDVTIYKLDVKINSSTIGRNYDADSPEYIKGFIKTPFVSDTDIDIKNTGVWLVRNTTNRFEQVKIIVDWITRYIKISNSLDEDSVVGFKNRSTSEFGIVNISASMLRFIGIPTRVITGVKISDEVKSYKWLEVYLPNGGWIPYDIIRYKNDKNYNIGSIDNNLIAFTKGVNNLNYAISNFQNGFYALQNNTSNSTGNIESYDIMWHNVEIK